MPRWKIILGKTAEKELDKLNRDSQGCILEYLYKRIATLNHPKDLGKPLIGNCKGLWRYRVDKFRIICRIEEDELVILVIKVAKRDIVYNE